MRKKDQIVALLEQGRSYREIERLVECSKATISYHAKQLGVAKGKIIRVDWNAVQIYHDQGHSRQECMDRFGFSRMAWHKAMERGALLVRDHRIPIKDLLVVGRKVQRGHLKSRLIREGLLESKCCECELTEWRGKPISLELHHINGIYNDNR